MTSIILLISISPGEIIEYGYIYPAPGGMEISTCIIIQITFPHPVMNQHKYTLGVQRNAPWKVAFHFGKSVGTGEVYSLEGVFTARDGPIPHFRRYSDMPISTSADIGTIFDCRYQYCWYAGISNTDTGIGTSLFTAFFEFSLDFDRGPQGKPRNSWSISFET